MQPNKHTIAISDKDAATVNELVKSGAYQSQSEVIAASIEALQAQNRALEDWLAHDVLPVYDAMIANPERGIAAGDVFAAILDKANFCNYNNS